MRKRYLIEVSPTDQLIVFCPQFLLENQNITRIAFGSRFMNVEFLPHPDHDDRIVISREIQKVLQYPNLSIPLHAFIENEVLTIGPLVGIFTAGFTLDPEQPIGERSSFFSKLLSVNKTVGAHAFVFGEQHIDWDKGTIEGLFFDDNAWRTFELPFPNVIYDRLPNRKSERLPKLRRVKERMQKDYLIPWYNPGFFNKLDVYERLQQDGSVENYLPETRGFLSFSQIESMLAEYGHVYIKPKNGSLGLGVHQIIYDKQTNRYYCRYQDREAVNRLRRFTSLEQLFENIFYGVQLEKMVVQQGIHLLRNKKRPIDFRVHTNKDEAGKWQVTAIAAKIAGLGSVTTHKRSGGEIRPIEELFTKEECKVYKQKLSHAAILLSQALEQNMEGIVGEIGFDLGIDRNGDVWLFEANSKPGRAIFSHPDLKHFDFLTRKLSIAFAVYLTEQSLMHPEEIYK